MTTAEKGMTSQSSEGRQDAHRRSRRPGTRGARLLRALARVPHLDGDYARVGHAQGDWDAVADGDIINDVKVQQ